MTTVNIGGKDYTINPDVKLGDTVREYWPGNSHRIIDTPELLEIVKRIFEPPKVMPPIDDKDFGDHPMSLSGLQHITDLSAYKQRRFEHSIKAIVERANFNNFRLLGLSKAGVKASNAMIKFREAMEKIRYES